MTCRIERHLSQTVILVQLLLLTAALVAPSYAQSRGGTYLSDDRARILSAQCGYGVMGYDTSMHLAETKGAALQIKDKVYEKGIGTHASAIPQRFKKREIS